MIHDSLDAIDEQAEECPDGIEEGSGHQHIEDGSPQLAERRFVMDDGVDIQARGNQETDGQRHQFNTNAVVRNINVGHRLWGFGSVRSIVNLHVVREEERLALLYRLMTDEAELGGIVAFFGNAWRLLSRAHSLYESLGEQ